MSALKPTAFYRRGFTLVEMLVAMAILGMLTNAALRFYYDGSRFARLSAERAQLLRVVPSVQTAWRQLVHARAAALRVTSKQVDFADRSSARVDRNRLFFTNAGHTRSFALPRNATAEFAQETGSGEASFLVLRLNTVKAPGQPEKTWSLRLVAAFKPEEKP